MEYSTKGQTLLTAWLKRKNISIYQLAKLTTLSYPAVFKYIKSQRIPNLEAAIKIEKVTDGYVPCMSWEMISVPKKKAVKKDTNHSNAEESQEKPKHNKTKPKGRT